MDQLYGLAAPARHAVATIEPWSVATCSIGLALLNVALVVVCYLLWWRHDKQDLGTTEGKTTSLR